MQFNRPPVPGAGRKRGRERGRLRNKIQRKSPLQTATAESTDESSEESESESEDDFRRRRRDPNKMNSAKSNNSSSLTFNWADYLKETQLPAAPAHCFKQHLTPPENSFEPGMKIEVIDPSNTTSTCIATVIELNGPRLLLGLDGVTNLNDFWILVDSEDINPVGTCERRGGILQPPLEFRSSNSFWPKFLTRTLNGAPKAGAKCFKKEPRTPARNHFDIGMKLEAVDRKNPHLICVATVADVDGDEIYVMFDGWDGLFDYWTTFDSRDLFPVGWCSLSGHSLQPPGQNLGFNKNSRKSVKTKEKIIPSSSPSASPLTLTLTSPSPFSLKKRASLENLSQLRLKKSKSTPIRTLNKAATPQKRSLSVPVPVSSSSYISFPGTGTGSGPGTTGTGTGTGTGGDKKSRSIAAAAAAGSSTKSSGKSNEEVFIICIRSLLPDDPKEWTVDEVIEYIESKDVDTDLYADAFREHEIDGKAMTLLNVEMMMHYLGLKLGPALIIQDVVEKFRK